MAQFQGYRCDRCDRVVDADERTKQTVKYDGPEVEGEFALDLCPDCVVVPEDVTLKPLRRRRTKKQKAAEKAREAQEQEEAQPPASNTSEDQAAVA